MENPLFLFPEEVWEMIIHNLDDSTDAWNVFRAFPQLDNSLVLQKKKHLWLFGLVVPHLIPWKKTKVITEPMLLKCRRVCRHWSMAVDNYLENQPQLRAYHPDQAESQKRRNGLVVPRFHWNTKTYVEKNDFAMRIELLKKPSQLGGFYFDNILSKRKRRPKSLTKFLQAMAQHPPERNPFFSRSLSIHIEKSETEMEQFWDDAVTLHQKFGGHVHFYMLEFYIEDMGPRYPAECLSQLNNLKSLSLFSMGYSSGKDNIVELAKFVEAVDKNLPELPQLETLRFVDAHGELEKLGRLLIDRFSPQIRRLELQVSMWKPEYFNVFPNLTELDLIDILFPALGEVKELLMALEAPQLAKLKMTIDDMDEHEFFGIYPFSVEDDLFQWLKRFPNLKFLDFGDDSRAVLLEEKGTLDPAKDANHSLQFLSIRTSFGMTYNFLRCLPSLQHLNLYVPQEPVVNDISGDPAVRIREEIQTAKMYRSNVWEVLPKLVTVTLLMEHLNRYICASYPFNREDYEKTKNKRGEGSSSGSVVVPHCDPFRADIAELLHQSGDSMDEDSDDNSADDSDDNSADDSDDNSADDSDANDDDCWQNIRFVVF